MLWAFQPLDHLADSALARAFPDEVGTVIEARRAWGVQVDTLLREQGHQLIEEGWTPPPGWDGTQQRLPFGPRPDAWDPGQVPLPSDPIAYAAWRGLLGEDWVQQEGSLPYYQDSEGVRVMLIPPGTEDPTAPTAITVAQEAIARLDDQVASTFLIALGKWLADTGGDRREQARLHVAEILDFRGVKKHHKGGYRPEQKAETRKHLLALRDVWVKGEQDVWEPNARGKRQKVRVAVHSPLIEVEYETIHTPGDPEGLYAYRVRPGSWVDHFIGNGARWVTILLKQVMRYHPANERLPMRLGIYLAFQWRIRAAHGNFAQPWKMATLLEGAKIDLPTTNRLRFRAQVEAAIERLVRDGVLASAECLDRIAEDAAPHDWWGRWLDARWVLVPPPEVTACLPRPRRAAPIARRGGN